MATLSDQTVLTKGEHAMLRIWRDEEPSNTMPEESRPYETLGYIVSGSMELTVDGKTTTLHAGQAYNVPKNARHRYVVLERLTAIEAVAPAQ